MSLEIVERVIRRDPKNPRVVEVSRILDTVVLAQLTRKVSGAEKLDQMGHRVSLPTPGIATTVMERMTGQNLVSGAEWITEILS